jgi:plastocyanin
MSYRVNKFVPESYTNDLGQTLNPGDDVVFVTTGYSHHVRVETGKFEGVYRNLENEKVAGTRIGTVPIHTHDIVYAEDGEHEEQIWKGWDQKTWRYIYEKTGRRYNLIPVVKYRKSSLQRNRVFKLETPLAKVNI